MLTILQFDVRDAMRARQELEGQDFHGRQVRRCSSFTEAIPSSHFGTYPKRLMLIRHQMNILFSLPKDNPTPAELAAHQDTLFIVVRGANPPVSERDLEMFLSKWRPAIKSIRESRQNTKYDEASLRTRHASSNSSAVARACDVARATESVCSQKFVQFYDVRACQEVMGEIQGAPLNNGTLAVQFAKTKYGNGMEEGLERLQAD